MALAGLAQERTLIARAFDADGCGGGIDPNRLGRHADEGFRAHVSLQERMLKHNLGLALHAQPVWSFKIYE